MQSWMQSCILPWEALHPKSMLTSPVVMNTPLRTSHTMLFYGPGDIRLEEVEIPRLATGEALVRVGAALTCGTDQKTFNRGHPVIIKHTPSAFGHEMAGAVVAIAPGVKTVHKGDRVVVGNSAPCMECYYCRRRRFNLCENLTFLNGAFAEHIVVPAAIVSHNLHIIPEDLPFDRAALSEPLACVLNACEHMNLRFGETMAVMGTGPMAFLFIEVAKALGCRIVVVGRNPARLQMAEGCGADIVDTMREDAAQGVQRLTDGRGADVVIEAIGQPETWQQAMALAGRGGRICLYGGCPKGTTIKLDTYRLHYEGLSVIGVFHHTPQLFKKAISWLADGRIRTDHFLEQRRKLEDLPRIFQGLESAKPLKFVIEP